jgi:hypothetical protein
MIVDKIELDEDEKCEIDNEDDNNESIKIESKKKIEKVNNIIFI